MNSGWFPLLVRPDCGVTWWNSEEDLTTQLDLGATMFRCLAVLASLLAVISPAWGLEPTDNALFCRVVDVGAGECCVVLIPGGHYVIFDGGNFKDGGATVMDALETLLPEDAEVDLLVISHSDADHLAAIDDILDAYTVKTVLHTGDVRTTDSWIAADAAIRNAEANFGTENLNLRDVAVDFGREFQFGDAKVTFVAGWHTPPDEFGDLSPSEKRNAISVVIRIEYGGKSILFTGDSVGRHIDDPVDVCLAAERFMVDNQSNVTIKSDVLVAAHHGADNGSSTAFIQAVQPDYVIFSAGHAHQHPRAVTAERFMHAGLSPSRMLRTDRGDDEGFKEWDHLRIPNHSDPLGDDDVDILIHNDGRVQVEYREADSEEESLRDLLVRVAPAGRGPRSFDPSDLGINRFQPDGMDGNILRGRFDDGPEVAVSPEVERKFGEILEQLRDLKGELRLCHEDRTQQPCPQQNTAASDQKLEDLIKEMDYQNARFSRTEDYYRGLAIQSTVGITAAVVLGLVNFLLIFSRAIPSLQPPKEKEWGGDAFLRLSEMIESGRIVIKRNGNDSGYSKPM